MSTLGLERPTSYGQTGSPFSPQEIVDEMLTTAEVWDELYKRSRNGEKRADIIITSVVENHVPVLAFVGPKGLALQQQFQHQLQQRMQQQGSGGYGGGGGGSYNR